MTYNNAGETYDIVAQDNNKEFWQTLQVSNFQEETQQLLVGDLEGCRLTAAGATCHTSEKGGTCSCFIPLHESLGSCKSQNCARNCSASIKVSCDLSFPPDWNGLQAVNDTRWTLVVLPPQHLFFWAVLD